MCKGSQLCLVICKTLAGNFLMTAGAVPVGTMLTPDLFYNANIGLGFWFNWILYLGLNSVSSSTHIFGDNISGNTRHYISSQHQTVTVNTGQKTLINFDVLKCNIIPSNPVYFPVI